MSSRCPNVRSTTKWTFRTGPIPPFPLNRIRPSTAMSAGRGISHVAPFRAKRLDLGCFVNKWVLRDHTKRKVFAEHEVERQALRHIVRNTSLPQRMRAQAQLQLSQMHSYTQQSKIKDRCIFAGKGSGVLNEFKMSRFQFRLNAKAGNIPGVKKASW